MEAIDSLCEPLKEKPKGGEEEGFVIIVLFSPVPLFLLRTNIIPMILMIIKSSGASKKHMEPCMKALILYLLWGAMTRASCY